jgi:probable phosphoglycerate mutase
MRLLFIRHGEPNYELDCLTERGKTQAQLLAQRLKNAKIDELWVSPMGRARETAAPVAEILNKPLNTLEFMHEVDWNSTDGQPLFAEGNPWDIMDEMARLGLDPSRPDWRELSYFKTNSILNSVDYVEKNFDQWLAGYGYIREGYYYRHTVEEQEHRTVAIFSHGGSSSVAMSHMLNLSFAHVCAFFHMEFTSISILRLEKGKGNCTLPALERFNDAGHLVV